MQMIGLASPDEVSCPLRGYGLDQHILAHLPCQIRHARTMREDVRLWAILFIGAKVFFADQTRLKTSQHLSREDQSRTRQR